MLFDEDVAALVREHFVCVLTDAPWSKVSQRNAATWEEMEGWKSSPRSSEIVFVVTPDKQDRRGLVYHHYKEPAQLLAFLNEIVREDGRVEITQAERDRLTVQNRMWAKTTVLRRALHDALGKEARPAMQAFDDFVTKLSLDDYCAPEEIAETGKAIRADDPGARAKLEERVAAMLEQVPAELDDDPVVRAIRLARKTRSDEVGDVTGLLFTEALLRKRFDGE